MDEPVAIIAVLLVVIKELISFLKERKENGKKWTGEERRSANIEEVNNSIQLLVLPVMVKQTEILIALEKLARENSERMLNTNYTLQFGITGLKENDEKIRANLHAIGTQMQVVIGEIQSLDCRGESKGRSR